VLKFKRKFQRQGVKGTYFLFLACYVNRLTENTVTWLSMVCLAGELSFHFFIPCWSSVEFFITWYNFTWSCSCFTVMLGILLLIMSRKTWILRFILQKMVSTLLLQWEESTVGSLCAMVRFMTIHFYDPCPVGPSTPDLWCITVAMQASFLYSVSI